MTDPRSDAEVDAEMKAGRTSALEAILGDTGRRKVIVAGAGTGKTFTFGAVVKATSGRCLILTFLNMLVTDIAGALADQADVYSFHGFARRLLHSLDVPGVTKGVDYYPAIPAIYEADLTITDQPASWAQIEACMMNLVEEAGIVAAMLRSGDYYDAVGHCDSVFRIYQHLSSNPTSVPSYAQVLVDEYQDFSLLEVSLIERLASNPIIIVGDDDQALYGFRHASAKYIRDLVAEAVYARFELPYCTRCTEVLVAATHLVVGRAQAVGLLPERIDKQYTCFLPDKREDSARYSRIVHAQCTVDRNDAPYMARYIERFITQLDPEEIAESHAKGYPTVLIIGPKQFTDRIHKHFVLNGHPNVKRKTSSPLLVDVIDGYRRLLRDERSRLGWRILLHCHRPAGYEAWVAQALVDGRELVDELDTEYRDSQLVLVTALRRLRDGEAVADEDIAALEAVTGLTLAELLEALGVAEDADSDQERIEADTEASDEAPTILITSLMGSKGLQAAHVFITGLNDGHFPRHNTAPTEDEVCQLIVALTRARKSCTVLSCRRFAGTLIKESVFLAWLRPLLDPVLVNKAYLEA